LWLEIPSAIHCIDRRILDWSGRVVNQATEESKTTSTKIKGEEEFAQWLRDQAVQDARWLREKAFIEDQSLVSVGGLTSRMENPARPEDIDETWLSCSKWRITMPGEFEVQELLIENWNTGNTLVDGIISIERRPWYCDRGRYLVKTELPLDIAEGFPRYYFSLDVAKSEIAVWLKGRRELKGQRYGPEVGPDKAA
jgi:hypothetical protein